MIIFKRNLEPIIKKNLFKGSIIVILGPRQTGKTTLSKTLIEDFKNEGAYFDCQLAEVREAFVVGRPQLLQNLISDKKIVVFDEAQTIQNIGTILKVHHDHFPNTQIIATGSSSFDLANKIIEPMTGRAIEYTLLPLSIPEIEKSLKITKEILDDIFLYGSYPAVIAKENTEDKLVTIKNISTNYLYKDVFIFEAIRNPKIFEDLLKLLAFQMGQIVSIAELATSVGVSRSVVQKYIRLLEQTFIIKVVHSFSNNPRSELKKAMKIYFIDTGVRNALVGIKGGVESRDDKGFIFENFYFCELLKKNSLEIFPAEIMFWRTRKQLEIDFIEKDGKNIAATECKWSPQEVVFTQFLKKYPGSKTKVVTPNNFINS